MRRIEPNRAQYRQQFAVEVALDPLRLARVPFAALQKVDALFSEPRREHIVQYPVLVGHQSVRDLADAFQLFAGAQLIGSHLGRFGDRLLLQAGHPNLEELVQITTRNTQEPQALEQRIAFILGLFEHAPIELEQRQLAVDVELGIGHVERLGIHVQMISGKPEAIHTGWHGLLRCPRFN